MAYKMKGHSLPGINQRVVSPMKKGEKVQEYATKEMKQRKREKDTSGKYGAAIDKVKDVADNASKTVDHLTKKHNIYKGKRLTLKGQVDAPKVDASWNGGNPNIKVNNSGNLSANYKLSKNISANAGVNFKTGSKPEYNAGLNIRL